MSKPITSRSLAGVSERLILLPDLMGFGASQTPKILRTVIEKAKKITKAGVVILVPSKATAQPWTNIAAFPDDTNKVTQAVRDLQDGTASGPVVLANRYDGIDLPGEACRILIMDGLPKGTSEYDRFLAVSLHGGAALAGTLAQRIEQGIGRAARGSGDYCVVFMVGRDLNAWIGRSANSRALTSATRAQLTIGQDVSRDVADADDVFETVRRCLKRDKEWTEYHAETLAELADKETTPAADLEQAKLERDCLRLWRDGHTDKAIGKIATFLADHKDLDRYSTGWLLQWAARIAHAAGKADQSQNYQKDAYAKNSNLLRPQAGVVYERLARPGAQAEAIVRQIAAYRPRRAFMSHFEEVVAQLTADASANQFEEALKEFGEIIGFEGQRPERTYGVGPDVLWLLGTTTPTGMVIEAKTRKSGGSPLTKDDHGQLLTAEQWFQAQYSGYATVRVSVIPTPTATPNASAGDSKALTLASLQELIAEARDIIGKVVAASDEDEMVVRCEQLLRSSRLKPDRLLATYLKPFNTVKPRPKSS